MFDFWLGFVLTGIVILAIKYRAVIVDWLIRRAKRTPYFHLRDGEYMRRWWLVPYLQRKYRTVPREFVFAGQTGIEDSTTTDGTGPVAFRKRPLAWVIQRCGIAIRIHEIMDSDRHRDPHNHPWWYLTIILRGSYFEERFNANGSLRSGRWHGPGSIIFRRANSFHSLMLEDGWGFDSPIPVTTLFITGTKSQPWGFVTEEGFVPHMTYKAQHKLKLE